MSLKDSRAENFGCPRCGAPGGRKCITMNMRVRRTWKESHLPRLKRPHRERVIHAEHERELIARIKKDLDPENWK